MILKYTSIKGSPAISITSGNTGMATIDYYGKIFNYVYTDMYTPVCMYFSLRAIPAAYYSLNNHYFMFDYFNNFALQGGNANNVPSANQYERFEPRTRLRTNATMTTAYSTNPQLK